MHKQEFSGAYRYGCAPCIDVADDLASSLQDMVADQISRSNKETTQVQQQRNLPPLQEVSTIMFDDALADEIGHKA